MKQDRFLALAKLASKKSDHHTHKMGCVIVKGNKVLGTGFNLLKTHPKSPHSHKSIHAEFMAAMNAGFTLMSGSTAYIFREHKDGTWVTAKPCQYCWKFLRECGVKQIVYSFEGSFVTERVL